MPYFAVFVIALVMTIALIPPLIQYSGRLKLVDVPGGRKVHVAAIPRVGGIAMVLSILIPVFLWVEVDPAVLSLLLGIGVIFVFGVWDDHGDLDYRLKFAGQIIAAGIVVLYGDIAIKVVPFFGFDPVSPWFYIPLSIFVLVAVTNAINLADGLDGLAAGVVLLSLAGVAILALLADSTNLILITLAVIGSIAGFLRFNTYPARIFMGDTGSQFLGFSAGVLMIMLTQQVNTALNPAIPLLLLGLPLFDTLFVIIKRIYYGKSPFSPDKNHVHHHLLALNFDHYEAVVIIYLVQAVFVFSGIMLRYHSDLYVVVAWMFANASLAIVLTLAGRMKWRAHDERKPSILTRFAESGYKRYLYIFSLYILRIGVGLLLLLGPILVRQVDLELGLTAAILGMLLLLRLVFGSHLWFIYLRLLMYVVIAFVVFLIHQWVTNQGSAALIYENLYIGIIAAALVIGASYRTDDAFRTTPTDYLIVLLMIGSVLIPRMHTGGNDVIPMAVKLVIMFYAVEVLLNQMKGRWASVTLTALWAFGVIALKGLGFA
jgi:UDP-GlcNAc:undecaprenyl-phosphate/decaprenyl-phosphate GlcNAc-1-phosphate transferase